MRNFLIVCTLIMGLIACEKPAGEGGTSVIEGKVTYFTTSYNAQTTSLDTHYYPKSGKDIFIIYSDDEGEIYDDKFETDHNGKYRFEFLRKGKYTIFTHVDSVVVNDVTYDYPIFKHVEITSNNSIIQVPEFIIQK